jgi:hypothetical protein
VSFCPTLNKLESCRQILAEISNTEFFQNKPSGSQVIPVDGRTDGKTDKKIYYANIHLSQVFVKVPKRYTILSKSQPQRPNYYYYR